MGTKNEQTLQIQNFKGVSRLLKSTQNDPELFETLQNMFVVNSNELGAVGGVTKESNFPPGVDSFLWGSYLRTQAGLKKIILWFQNNISGGLIPTPTVTSANFTALGAASGRNMNFYVVYAGAGSTSDAHDFTTTPVVVNVGTTGTRFTTPLDVPSYVACINIYACPNAGGYARWMGSVTRRAGVFPTTIDLITTAAADPIFIVAPGSMASQPTGQMLATPSTGGTLVPGTTYYFGIAPWVGSVSGSARPRVWMCDSTNRTFAYTLPAGATAIDIAFTGIPATTNGGATAYNYNVLFMGITPEDLLPVCTRTDGAILPISRVDLGGGGSTVTIKELPYNSNQGIEITIDQGGLPTPLRSTNQWASDLRFSTNQFGYWENGCANGVAVAVAIGTATNGIGAWVMNQAAFSSTDAYQLLPNWSAYYGNTYQLQPTVDTVPLFTILPLYPPLASVQQFNRIYVTNGAQTPWATNGYTLSPIFRDYQTAMVPFTSYIQAVQTRLILSGGKSNGNNVAGIVYYSEAANPNSFTKTPSATPVLNTVLAISTGGGDEIRGLGIFSQNLLDTGPNTFLVIGKSRSVWVWNVDTAYGAQQIQNNVGWAGPNCYTRTQFGGVFVGNDNIYFMPSAQEITVWGDEVKDIIQALTETQRTNVSAVYHQNRVKIGYGDTGAGDTLLRELWLYMNQTGGGVQKSYDGPHALRQYKGQLVASELGSAYDQRFSYFGSDYYLRDDTSSYLNNGASVARQIVISRMGLQADHFWKVVNRIYLGLGNLSANTAFTFTLAFQDGSSSTFFTDTALTADGATQFFQRWVPTRVLGRVVKLTIDFTNSSNISIYDISLLSDQHRRRKLR